MNARGFFSFVAGAVVGAAAGLVTGIMVAPRAGVETRDMVAQGASDAWDSLVDNAQKGTQSVVNKATAATDEFGAKTDELREKVDQARARMDQIRSNLADSVTSAGAPTVSAFVYDGEASTSA